MDSLSRESAAPDRSLFQNVATECLTGVFVQGDRSSSSSSSSSSRSCNTPKSLVAVLCSLDRRRPDAPARSSVYVCLYLCVYVCTI